LIHIGVLRYLEEHDYTIKEIAGTSIGSLIGVLVALGKKSDEIYDLVAQIDNSDIIDIDRKNISIGGKNIIKKLQEIA
jgi:NTE family protein